MNELPNPFESLSYFGDSFTVRISNKFSNLKKLKKLHKLFPKLVKKSSYKTKKSKLAAESVVSTIQTRPDITQNITEKVTQKINTVETPTVKTKAANPIQVTWARHLDQVKEAQQLRYQVFAEEMGANLPKNSQNLDVDMFDKYCDHLIVRDLESLKVIGTYRALPPHQAKQIGCLYSDSEFDLIRLNHLRHKIVEVGRSCVHKDYRSGGVIMSLWGGLGQYMQQNNYEIMLGCASVPMGDGGHYAASLNRILSDKHLSPIEYRAFPRLALPLDSLNSNLDVEPPPLVKGYIRLGAKICGEPAWDPDFNTADFLTMLRLSDINPRYAKHFL
jgi:putative hemolysin